MYYKVVSSHWPLGMEFKYDGELALHECFRIKRHDGDKNYPTRMKVVGISEEPEFIGRIVTILEVDTNVEPF